MLIKPIPNDFCLLKLKLSDHKNYFIFHFHICRQCCIGCIRVISYNHTMDMELASDRGLRESTHRSAAAASQPMMTVIMISHNEFN